MEPRRTPLRGKKNKQKESPELIAARKRAVEELGLKWQEPPKRKKPRKGHIPPPGDEFPHGEESRPAAAFDFNLDFYGKSVFGACACDGADGHACGDRGSGDGRDGAAKRAAQGCARDDGRQNQHTFTSFNVCTRLALRSHLPTTTPELR